MWLDVVKGYVVFELFCVSFFAIWWASATVYALIKGNPLHPRYVKWTAAVLVCLGLGITMTYGAFQLDDETCNDNVILLEKE